MSYNKDSELYKQVELYNLSPQEDKDKDDDLIIHNDEDEWIMIEQNNNDDQNNLRNSQNQLRSSQKKSSFNFLFKNRVYYSLYNMYHSKPSEPPKFSKNPIWLLGKEYICKSNFKLRYNGHVLYSHAYHFLQDFPRIIYFCYRKDFPRIQAYNTSTDIGWGCMARTGQMILALSISNILGYKIHSPNNSSSFDDDNNEYLITDEGKELSNEEINIRISIISLFLDFPDPPSSHPFSIHQIIEQNLNLYGYDMKNEYWFSPTKISFVLKSLVQRYYNDHLKIYVATDGVIYEDKIELKREEENEYDIDIPKIYPNTYSENPSSDILKPLLILIPIRLGVDKLNHMYIDHLKSILRCRFSVGIIGGKPNKSMYFVGYQDDYILYLDPHFVDTTIKPEKLKENIHSYSVKYPHRLKFEDMDPSMAIGFLIKNDKEFNEFKKLYKKRSKIFSIIKHTPEYLEEEESQ